ncbi:HD-GYP domain-containing protein [Proteinivorax tanatarense]|uniref:HD-GYP domain-containing protein n=1 Tax=Proteinivorax tanatarense TaxID=1260629 RepID=A0AAU7VQG4_9FIRM
MRKIFIDLVKDDDVLALPVEDANGNILLAKGSKIKQSTKDKLSKHGITTVYIKEGNNGDNIEPLEGNRDEALKMLKRQPLEEILISRINNYSRNDNASPIVKKVVEDIIFTLKNKNTLLVHFAHLRLIDNYTYEHSLDVCALSLVIGERLRLTRTSLYQLGLGALLHDVGKTKVSISITSKQGKLTDKEFERVKEHPLLGFQLLKDFDNNIPLPSCQVVLQHHERYSGTGYPRGLKGEKISKLSYIVGICDMYTAITAKRSYREAFSPKEAIELFMGTCNYLFPTQVVEAFLEGVAAYPNGSVVKLSNGLIAKVIMQDTLALKPIVKPLKYNSETEIRLVGNESLDIECLYE